MSVDDLVERLFGTLDELGENRDTLAFYLSDNGQMWGEHGLGDKRVPYLPSIQIPLLMRWPGHIEPSTDNRLVANDGLSGHGREPARRPARRHVAAQGQGSTAAVH
jgi:arylsulfatase A-like enzyme